MDFDVPTPLPRITYNEAMNITSDVTVSNSEGWAANALSPYVHDCNVKTSFMGTAGTMQVMCEALGLTLPGSALLPAKMCIRDRF